VFMDDERLEILLHSRDPVLLSQTIMDLCRGKVHAAVPALVKLLAFSNAAVRANAAYALGELGRHDIETVAPALVYSLADPDSLVRSEAVEALGLLGYTPAIDCFMTLLQNDEDSLVRASTAEVLGDLGQARAVKALLQALHDPDDSVRAFAANSIGLLGTPELLPLLQTQLDSEEIPRVKAELLGARYRLGKPEGLQRLLNLLTNADESLATVILNILEDVEGRKTPSALSSDTARISEALTVLCERVPVVRLRAQRIIERLNNRIA
jgi:HEAT repeat protein